MEVVAGIRNLPAGVRVASGSFVRDHGTVQHHAKPHHEGIRAIPFALLVGEVITLRLHFHDRRYQRLIEWGEDPISLK
jgi:hypothetical protein